MTEGWTWWPWPLEKMGKKTIRAQAVERKKHPIYDIYGPYGEKSEWSEYEITVKFVTSESKDNPVYHNFAILPPKMIHFIKSIFSL